MWTENKIFLDDLEALNQAQHIPWNNLKKKTILITGATGLIGQMLVSGVLYANKEKSLDLRVVALVRNEKKARTTFESQLEEKCPLHFVEGTVEQLPQMSFPVDYIIHGASPTASQWFVQNPVETINAAVTGTMNMLDFARQKGVEGFAYLSSMEVYGFPPKGTYVAEDYIGGFLPTITRNSYPMSKQICECLCCSYATEYQLPVMVLRLTQTFGPGVVYDDKRVFAEFARCAIEKKDIVLKTKGETERSYLYTGDAVSGIFTALLKGQPGHIYNAATEDSYCSIAQMAELVAEMSGISVRYELQNVDSLGYAPTLYMNLDTSKLRSLGWRPTRSLCQMFERMIETMKQSR